MRRESAKVRFPFVPHHGTVQEILNDHGLASLGDAYTNLIYSLYLSVRKGKPAGAKADSHTLSNALRQSGLRSLMNSRVDRHDQADAAEALLAYAWLSGLTTITRSVSILSRHDNVQEAFALLLSDAMEKLGSD
jgi:hypothetical protein